MTDANRPALRGTLRIPGDKSISHRAIMLGALSRGMTEIRGFLPGADCLSTIDCFRAMGIQIEREHSTVRVYGRGLRGLSAPDTALDCGNSGTTIRLLSGILASQRFSSVLTGDASIQKRPMGRVMLPLTEMGAKIRSVPDNGCAPLAITGAPLCGIHYSSPVASAQVKSAVLLAGLRAEGETGVTEPTRSRDHSERMLRRFGAAVRTIQNKDGSATVTVAPAEELFASSVQIPGDISSAAYFIAAALMLPDSELLLKNVGINPTRSGILDVIRAMGATPELSPCAGASEESEAAEPAADIRVRSAKLHGTEIGGALIPRLIDELPLIAALACAAEGKTVIRDATELRVKESDRIRVMTEELTKMGAAVTATPDGMIIEGGHPLHGASVLSHGDHRIAMTFAVLSLLADSKVTISEPDCVKISAPHFFEDLRSVIV